MSFIDTVEAQQALRLLTSKRSISLADGLRAAVAAYIAEAVATGELDSDDNKTVKFQAKQLKKQTQNADVKPGGIALPTAEYDPPDHFPPYHKVEVINPQTNEIRIIDRKTGKQVPLDAYDHLLPPSTQGDQKA